MLVWLKQDWFGPDQRLYPKSTKGLLTPVPDQYRSQLPSSSRVEEDGELTSRDVKPVDEPVSSLRDLDEVRDAEARKDAIVAKAEAARELVEAERRKPRRA